MMRPTYATAPEEPGEAAGQGEPAAVLAGGVAIGSGTFTLIARAPAGGGVEAVEQAAGLALQARAGLLDVGRALQALGPAVVAACERASGPPIVCSVSAPAEVAEAAEVAAMLRVPAAAAAGDDLLARTLGRAGCPVLLERGGATVEAWLHAAGRIAREGGQVALCASGGPAPGTDPEAGPGLDLVAVPSLRAAGGLPLVVDATGAERGHRNAAALARAAAAVGADGVVVGVGARHGAGDGEPAGMAAEELDGLASELEAVTAAVGRRMAARRIRYVGGQRDGAGARRWRLP
jgi:3-deoxy-D-arabino-heptulosonate 7-phosphate (DAHP) synthase